MIAFVFHFTKLNIYLMPTAQVSYSDKISYDTSLFVFVVNNSVIFITIVPNRQGHAPSKRCMIGK